MDFGLAIHEGVWQRRYVPEYWLASLFRLRDGGVEIGMPVDG